jgi:hypothetical protein
MLSVVTAVFSALLDNVTTVLLIVPVTLLICHELDLSPYPYLFAEIFASNIGGTATLIGDPPNIMIGSAVHLTFNDFLFNLAPQLEQSWVGDFARLGRMWWEPMANHLATTLQPPFTHARELCEGLIVIRKGAFGRRPLVAKEI